MPPKGVCRIDWGKYDPIIREGKTPSRVIADEAGCSQNSIIARRRKLGLVIRCSGPIQIRGYSSTNVFDYWGWLKGEIGRLGKAEVIRRYGYQGR